MSIHSLNSPQKIKRGRHVLPFPFLCVFAALFLGAFPGFIGLSQDELPEDVLRVTADESLGAVSPYVFGAGIGPSFTLNPEYFDEAKAAGISILRFPGGNWGDQNNLRPEQIDFFMIQCRAVGAEPSIHVRVEGGTPEQAAELVRYANIQKKYNVRYWYIGNEPNLYDDYTVERFNTEWRAYAEAMKAVDPTIMLIAPEVSQYPPSDPSDEFHKWVREFLKVNGDLVDMVGVHRYPFPQGRQVTTIEAMRNNSKEWDVIIPHLRQVVAEAAGREIPVAITEVNSHWANAVGGEASMDSHYNAIWWADVLGRLIRQRVEMVIYFTLSSAPDEGAWGMMARYELRPTYYVYPLYQKFGREVLQADSSDPDVSIYASLREDGALTLMVVNLGPDEKTKRLEITGFAGDDTAEVWRFDTEHNAEQIDSLTLGDAPEITVPGQSVTLYILPQAE